MLFRSIDALSKGEPGKAIFEGIDGVVDDRLRYCIRQQHRGPFFKEAFGDCSSDSLCRPVTKTRFLLIPFMVISFWLGGTRISRLRSTVAGSMRSRSGLMKSRSSLCKGHQRVGWRVGFDHHICNRIDLRHPVCGNGLELFIQDGPGHRTRPLNQGPLHSGILCIERAQPLFRMDGADAEYEQVWAHAGNLTPARPLRAAPISGLTLPPVSSSLIPGRPMTQAAIAGSWVGTVRGRSSGSMRANARLTEPTSI